MKNLFLFTTLMMSFAANAGFPIFKVKNLGGTYVNKNGSAFAEYAYYNLEDVQIEHKVIHVKFNNVDKNLVLRDANTAVRLKFDFSFLNVFKSLDFDAVNASSEKNKFTSNINELGIFIEPSEYILNNLKISSDLTNADVNADEIDILEGFIMHGELELERLAMQSAQADTIQDELGREFPDLRAEGNTSESPISIPLVGRNLKLTIKDKRFSGSMLLDSWINAWLNLAGSLDYNKDKELLKISIDKAKLGVFSVRSWLLNKIKKLNLDTVKVQGNVIIVSLGQNAGVRRGATRFGRK